MNATYEGTANARFQLLQHQLLGRIKIASQRAKREDEAAAIGQLLGSFLITLGNKLGGSSKPEIEISPQPTKS